MKTSVLLLACLWWRAEGALPPFITPCKASDANCLKTSAQKALPILAAGIPELNVESMDPMKIEVVRADQAGLKVEFRKTVVRGLRNCNVLSLKRQGKRQSVELKCSVTLVGEYTIGGKLLVLPVEGDGKYKIKIRDIIVKVNYEVSEVQRGGDAYWTIGDWKHSAQVQTSAEFQFQNLFNGNKQLSDTVHQFANSNWKDIFNEVAPPIVKVIVTKIIGEIDNFYKQVPIKELTLA